MLEVDSAFARQGWRGCSGSSIIELGGSNFTHELHHWKSRADVFIFLVEAKTGAEQVRW